MIAVSRISFDHTVPVPVHPYGSLMSSAGEGPRPVRTHVAMEPTIWISFDDTLPAPALASPCALPRESVIDLFERGRALSQLQWHKDRVLIRPEDEDGWENAEEIRRIVVEDVELYDFTGSIFSRFSATFRSFG